MFMDFIAGATAGVAPASILEELSFYDRGVTCSGPSEAMDLIEAHKWFNLAAMSGDERGAAARVDVAMDMTPRETAEAQRRARDYLRSH